MNSTLMDSISRLLNEYKLPLVFGAGTVFGVVTVLGTHMKKENSKWDKDPVKDYCYSHTNIIESPAMKELRKITSAHPRSVMESTPDVGQLLVFLMRTIKAKTVVEVGSFSGVGLLKMAEQLPDEGKIFSLDISEEFANIGKPLMEKAGVLSKIVYKIAPATESLIELKKEGYAEKVDLCFIDADKPNYPNYYKLCMELVRPGGIIVFDNSLFGHGVVTDPHKEPYCYIHEANEKGAVDSRVTSMLLNVGDGCLILRKHDAE